jgi:subtilisin family serine protease
LRALPRVAVLVPLEGFGRPVTVDAWTALQTLRAAASDDDAPKVRQLGLEHVLISSAIAGSPIDGGGGGIAGGSGNGDDVSGPTPTDSYLFSGGDPRSPVAVFLEPPARRSADECACLWGGRLTTVVLDSGVAPQETWLNVGADGTTVPGGFVAVDDQIQDAIRAEGQQAADHGDRPRQVIKDARDDPMAHNPLIGELSPAYGHGTAIAGIVRQVAPDVQLLALRALRSDDGLGESDVICALRHLAERIALDAENDLVAQVGVVSLSFGYFSESRHDRMLTSGLWKAIKVLLSLGVVVVAAAGNYASRRFFYPAAFALEPVAADEVPVISVGALNPNGTKAVFSNDGRWVTAWAPGAAVVTTYPTDAGASRTPQLRVPLDRKPAGAWPQGREALDPNDFSAGFAVWSGTSFAAPYAAGLVARSLLHNAAGPDPQLRLDQPGIAARKRRAQAAVDRLPRQIA